MRLALFFLCTLLTSTLLQAQQDSTGMLRVYKSLLQEQTLPALVADNGKQVIQVHTIYQVNTIRNVEQPFQSFQTTYRTQWRKHGFGLVYEGIPGATIWSNSVGLQYGYGILFNQKWLRNTKLSAGAGVHFIKVSSDFSKMTFADQIDPYQGVIRSSGEEEITNSVNYRRYEVGLLLRSNKLFLGIDGNNLNEATTGFYKSTPSGIASTLIINAGIKLVERKWFSSWATYEQQNSKNTYTEKIGLTLAIRNRYLFTCYQTKFDGPHFRFAYATNHVRAFVQYQQTDNDYVGYFGYGNLLLGMAYAIGKQ